MSMDLQDKRRLEKIAKMAIHDVPNHQIARAVGLTEGRITQIMASEEFKELIGEFATEYIERNQTLNDGWDHAEATALKTVVESLGYNKDPDFALRVAAMANKANRRGQFNNRPIDGRAGIRAVLHLSAQFVQNIQNNNGNTLNVTRNSNKEIPNKKDSDFMPAETIERMFMSDEEKSRQELLSFFPELQTAAAE